MANWQQAADVADLDAECGLAITLCGKAIGLYRIGDEIVATGDICPHRSDVRLSEGWLEDGVIECPMHQSRFDLKTGQCLSPPAYEDIPVYGVVVRDGAVFVDVD